MRGKLAKQCRRLAAELGAPFKLDTSGPVLHYPDTAQRTVYQNLKRALRRHEAMPAVIRAGLKQIRRAHGDRG